jgi:hypothetical protein
MTLIDDLVTASPMQVQRIAYTDSYFGLVSTTSADDRTSFLQEEVAMRGTSDEVHSAPARESKGSVNQEDGHEYLEHPENSGLWYIRNTQSGDWEQWTE